MATRQDIAEQTGVSVQTVSAVLAGKARQYRISEKRETLIKQAAQSMGYRPNAAARATRRGRFGAIALLLGTKDGRSELPKHLLNGIQDATGERDLNLMVVRLPDEQLTDSDYVPRILRETSSDGLLIDYTHSVPDRMLELIDNSGMPVVWLNTQRPRDCVRPNDLLAGRTATEHLLTLGHQCVVYADFGNGPDIPELHYSAVDRKQAYIEVMQNAGFTPTVSLPTHGEMATPDERYAMARGLLSQPDRPTGVICYGSTTAWAFFGAANDLGLSIPEDLSVLTFDNAVSPMLWPPCASMILPNTQMGRQAVAMLTEKIKHPAEPIDPVLLPFEFVAGGSCAGVRL